MIRLSILASLVAYSVVASQPLFYLFSLGRAQRALSAAAYIELRQQVNAVMQRRVPVVYLGALATLVLVLVLSLRLGDRRSLVAASVALLCLVADVFVMVRASLPVNGVMDRWSTTDYPEDWARHRAQWFGVFAYRQAVLAVGLFALLAGAVFRADR